VAVLQIVGNQPGAGKTSLAAALLVMAMTTGRKAAYLKPFSSDPGTDLDVAFIAGLLQSSGGLLVPAPRPQTGSANAGVLDELQAALARLDSEADVVVIEGPDASAPLDLNSRAILVHGYSQKTGAAAVAASMATAGGSLAGVLVNSVPMHRRDEVARDMGAQDIPVAVIPESRGMLTVTVEQLAEHLGGQWVLDPVNTDAPVERFMIGGNIMDEGPTYFGRYANQAVITRVERPDIQMACIGEKTSCLVLTGPGEPTEYVKAEALQREVPLIQVRTNTMDTADSLAGLLDKADARTAAKASHFAGLLQRYMGADVVEGLLS